MAQGNSPTESSLFLSLTNSLIFVYVTHLGEYRKWTSSLAESKENCSGNRISEEGCEKDEYGDLNPSCLLEMERQEKIEVPLPGILIHMPDSHGRQCLQVSR